MEFAGKTALVTGASSGIGAEFARVLAARGANLVLVARRAVMLDELAASLRLAHRITVITIAMDLTRPAVGRVLYDDLASRGIEVDVLVNNAGFATYGAFAEEDPDRIAGEIQLNVVALVDLARAFLPDMLRARQGVIVNLASTAGFQAVPRMAVYSASKAFVLHFTEAIRHETRNSGVTVLALCPGATGTEFFDVVGTTDAAVGRLQTPSQVVATALRALDKRRTPARAVSGGWNQFGAAMVGMIPRNTAVGASGRMVAGSGGGGRR